MRSGRGYRAVLALVLIVCALAFATLARAACGDAALDGPEQCDDGNLSDGDCCSAACLIEAEGSACNTDDLCFAAIGATCSPEGTCNAAQPLSCELGLPAKLRITNRLTPSYKRFFVRMRGLYYLVPNVGNPQTQNDYAACVYDGAYDESFRLEITDVLIQLDVAHGTGWRASGDGWMFRGSESDPAGVTKVKLGGRTASLVASGENLALPDPEEPDRYFALDDDFGGRTLLFGIVNDNGYCALNYIVQNASARENSATEFEVFQPKRD